MRLAASALSAARPLAPYLRIATQRPSPPTQPQARPRTAAALRPHGLHPSPDRKHGPAAIQPIPPGRGWRPAARSAPPALRCRRRSDGPRLRARSVRLPAAPIDWTRGGGGLVPAMGARLVAGVGPSLPDFTSAPLPVNGPTGR